MTFDEYMNALRGKSVTVIGLGVSNMPLVELLATRGACVRACDKRTAGELGADYERLKKLGVELSLGESYLDNIDAQLIFRTPSLMPFDEHLTAAAARGCRITSEMEAFFEVCPCRTVAVTGSDGKTTTATVISELLKAAGHTVRLGGNIGRPLLCDVPSMKPSDFAVLELSSFQLHSIKCTPDVAVITNISPNHLDKHIDYQDYIDAKSAIFASMHPDARLVLNLADTHSEYYKGLSPVAPVYFSRGRSIENGVFSDDVAVYAAADGERKKILDIAEIKLPGAHNLENYMAAFAAVRGMVPNDICRAVAREFAGVEHRLEHVRTLRGVEFINDSIGTSPTRTAAGLHALKTAPILIAGGYDKHIPFDSLGDDICLLCRAVYLTGATAGKILEAIKSSPHYDPAKLPVFVIDDFDEAVLTAAKSAGEGDIVLLSPACAAFDKFKNFMERGEHFKDLVMNLK